MGTVEDPFGFLSSECKMGRHDACPGQILSPSGPTNCQCPHHKNTPFQLGQEEGTVENTRP
jgi:hypothetical protein